MRERGVWPSVSRERRRIKELKHGTLYAYNEGCRCEPCREEKRAKKRRAMEREPGTHGVNGYVNFGCRCDVCRDEHREFLVRQLESRKSRPEETPHGTKSGYNFWGCRCDPCKTALAAKTRKRTAQVQAETADRAKNHRKEWTGPELEVIARTDLTCREAALLLGRTYAAIIKARKKLRELPRYQNLAGIPGNQIDLRVG